MLPGDSGAWEIHFLACKMFHVPCFQRPFPALSVCLLFLSSSRRAQLVMLSYFSWQDEFFLAHAWAPYLAVALATFLPPFQSLPHTHFTNTFLWVISWGLLVNLLSPRLTKGRPGVRLHIVASEHSARTHVWPRPCILLFFWLVLLLAISNWLCRLIHLLFHGFPRHLSLASTETPF